MPASIDSTSRYGIGSLTYTHKGKLIISSVGSPAFDAYVAALDAESNQLGNVPADYGNRPDLISFAWYGTTSFWWKILLMNNIADPFENMNSGDPILLPKS